MKGFIAGVILILFFYQAHAQSSFALSHQVMVPAAGVIMAGGTSYQQTVGETAVEIFILSPYTLTQGFQQPRFIPDTNLPPVEGNGVTYWPNPLFGTPDYILNIRIFGDVGRNYNIIISNFSGSIVYRGKEELYGVHDRVHQVDMTSMANGIYVTRVISSDGFIDRSFKIDKL